MRNEVKFLNCPGCGDGLNVEHGKSKNGLTTIYCHTCNTARTFETPVSGGAFNQTGQTVHGTQTNIGGNVHGVVLGGNFRGPVTVAAVNHGSGAVALGGVASGAGGVVIGGNLRGGIVVNNGNRGTVVETDADGNITINNFGG